VALSNGFRQPLGNGNLTEAIDGDGFHVETNFNQYNPGFNAYHLGEDWNADGDPFADLGIPVYAISNGTVVERGVLESFGNYLIIRHDLPAPITVNGITTSTVYSLYGHLQNPAIVSVGDVVSIGQQIGNVGYTGLADGNPHLHLEIRLGNGAGYENTDGYSFGGAPAGWVDPADFINAYRTLTGAPLLSGTSPADNTIAVAVGSNIVLTFNEAVMAGSGNILIYNSNGTVAQTIAVTDAGQVSFSGNTVTINPRSDLAPNSGYYVNLGAGVIKDIAGNSYAGLSGSTAFNFTTAGPDLAGNTLAAARVVALGSTPISYTDYVGPTDTNDYYKFTTTGTTMFALSLTGMTGDADVYLLNSQGTEVAHSYNFGTTAEAINVSNLAAGTYYVQVKPYNTASTNYTLGLSAAALADNTSPLLSSMSPADNATAVAVDSNIVLTFNEAVAAGLGNIVLYNSNGTVARSIAVTDTSQVSFSGNTVTINPSSDLAANSGYYVNLGAGVIKDIAGTSYAGISDSAAFNFATVTTPDLAGNTLAAARAVTLGTQPSSYADYVGPTDTNDYYKFTTTGTTKFALSLTGLTDDADVYLLNSKGTEVAHSYNFGTTAEAINVSNLAAGTYYVQVKPYNSAATNYTLGLSATPVAPVDTTAPLLSSMSPADNATAVAVGSNIVLTFNEAVMAGSGNILIYNSRGTVAKTIAVTDTSQVSFSDNTVTINPSGDLTANNNYYVNLGAGVIKDIAGNSYAGISGSTAFNFATVTTPDLAGNTLAAARVVPLGRTTSSYGDYVGPTDTDDYFKFTTTSPTKFALNLTGLTDDADVYLLNSNGAEVAHSYNYGTAPEAISMNNLAAGTYYVQIHSYHSAATPYVLDLMGTPL
jgi:methionine-rich copper-binding protein CopC